MRTKGKNKKNVYKETIKKQINKKKKINKVGIEKEQ